MKVKFSKDISLHFFDFYDKINKTNRGGVFMTVFIALFVLLIVILATCLKIVPQAHEYVIEFLGKYKTTWSAGLHFKIPLL